MVRKGLLNKYLVVIITFLVISVFHVKSQSLNDSVIIVNDIQILGNQQTKDYVILREMSTKIGDTLKQEKIERDRNNIYNLGLFNKVDIEYFAEQGTAILYVKVSERWYIIPYPIFGIRYRDPNKLYYGGGFVHQNFRGRNEKIFLNACFGYDKWISLGYSNPKITDRDDIFLSSSIAVQKIHDLSKGYGEYENSNIFLNTTLGKRFGLYQTFYVYVSYEIWQVNNPDLMRTISRTGRDAFVTAGTQYRYDTRNNREYTTDGSLISLSLSKYGFGESEINFTRFLFDVRKFFGFSIGSGFGIRTCGTFFWGGPIPSYKHVFFGYDERIRGHFYNVYEGENKIGTSLEFRVPILLPRYVDLDFIKIPGFQKLRYGLYFGIFADAGRIWWRNQQMIAKPWYSGYGTGLQFLLPYAFTIRTEIAVNNFGRLQGLVDFDTSF